LIRPELTIPLQLLRGKSSFIFPAFTRSASRFPATVFTLPVEFFLFKLSLTPQAFFHQRTGGIFLADVNPSFLPPKSFRENLAAREIA
jgi:hypothetical protein